MSSAPRILLLNPPLWNPYAPYLAVPLLAGALRAHGRSTRGLDLNAEFFDWVLDGETLDSLAPQLETRFDGASHSDRPVIERALLVLPAAAQSVAAAKATLRSEAALNDHGGYCSAHVTLRDCFWCLQAAFPALHTDFTTTDTNRLPGSTAQVLELVSSAENPYRWAFDRLLEPYLSDAGLAVVGISLTAHTQLVPAMTAAAMCRELRPDVHVVVGGNFATRMASRWTHHHPFCDLVDSFLLYEGEESLPLLCDRLLEGTNHSVPGLVTTDGERVSCEPPRNADLSATPVPRFEDMPLSRYLSPGPVLPTYASRSCAWNCAFCSIPYASGEFRRRDRARIVDEMEQLSDRHRSRYFMFADEIMTLRSMREVAAELLERGSDLRWYAETRFSSGWTSETAELLHASGCRRLNFGLESFNQRVLDRMGKGTSVGYIPKNVDVCLEAGIPVHLFAIIGFPGEDEREAENTVRFAQKTVRRSRDLFGLPYSTWGASPFYLDVHSPVALDPDRYGVRPTPAGEGQDLVQALHYSVERGMSPEDIDRFFERRAHRRAGSPEGREALWFHESSSKECEEEIFVRACAGSGCPSPPMRAPEVWPMDLDGAHVSLSDLCVTRAGATVSAYLAGRGYLVRLRPEAAAWFSEPRTPRPFDEHEAALDRLAGPGSLRLLARHGFLRWHDASPAMAIETAWDLDRPDLVYRQEPAVTESDDGGSMLVSPVTGRIARLNRSANAVWRSCDAGLASSSLKQVAPGDHRRLLELMARLLAAGFVHASVSRPA